jgi:hypothetical protein
VAGELEKVANDLMAALDSKDLDRIVGSIGEDAQGVDEISRRWLRGRGELDNYLRQMIGAVSGVRSELRDAQERVWGRRRSPDLLARQGTFAYARAADGPCLRPQIRSTCK